jgi:hypothetical protein
MMIHCCTFISQNRNKFHITCKDWNKRKHKNRQANFFFNFFLLACRVPFSLAQRPLLLWSLPLMLQNLHYHRPLKQITSHAVHRLRSYNFVAKLYIIPTTVVQLEIILKRSCQKQREFYRYLLNLLRIKLSTHQKFLYCPNHWVIIRNKSSRHTFSSTVEILENSFWS